MAKQLILGAPGTGKTTKLLSIIREEVANGIPIERIGLFTFSKAAAEEAKSRLNLHRTPKMFRTLHSLAFMLIGASKPQVLWHRDYCVIAKSLGMPPPSSGNLDEIVKITVTDTVKFIEEQCRLRKCNPGELSVTHYDDKSLRLWTEALEEYKRTNHKIDFIDMLEKASELPADVYPAFETLFIDEAQDLNPLQWKMVDKLIHNSKKVYIAGDDDQCIYDFNGADVEHFLALSQRGYDVTTLDKSYRVPDSIWNKSQQIINQIQDRYPKEVEPKCEGGDFIPLFNENEINNWIDKFENKDVMILARTRSQVRKLEAKFPTAESIGAKTLRCMTLHQSKGLEADVVICDMYLGKRTRMFFDLANETRLFYVGMTRAKELFLGILRHDGYNIGAII